MAVWILTRATCKRWLRRQRLLPLFYLHRSRRTPLPRHHRHGLLTASHQLLWAAGLTPLILERPSCHILGRGRLVVVVLGATAAATTFHR